MTSTCVACNRTLFKQSRSETEASVRVDSDYFSQHMHPPSSSSSCTKSHESSSHVWSAALNGQLGPKQTNRAGISRADPAPRARW